MKDTPNVIEESWLKSIDIVGDDCCDNTQLKQEQGETTKTTRSAVCISLSAKKAFIYRKAGNINLNGLEDIKHRVML